jgi:hypothetical protein
MKPLDTLGLFISALPSRLAVYAVSFDYKLLKVAGGVFILDEGEMILATLASSW